MTDLTSSYLWFWLYLVAASVLAGASAYVWLTWAQVRGLLGLAMAILLTCVAITAGCIALLHANDPRVETVWILAVNRAAWPGIMISALIMADVWGASRNDHRSLTTRIYTWYKAYSSRPERRGNERGVQA